MNLAKIFERFKNNYESLEIFENPLRSFYIFYISSKCWSSKSNKQVWSTC